MEHDPRREGADDHRRSCAVGQPREQERDGKPDQPDRARGLEATDRGEHRWECALAHEQAGRDEPDGDAGDRRHVPRAHRSAGGERADHAQDDEPEDIVNHGGAENHLAVRSLEEAQITEHARRNSDAGGRESRRAHQRRHGRHVHGVQGQIASGEGKHDAGRGDRASCAAHRPQRLEVGLHPDFEEQDEHADLGEGDHRRVGGIEDPQHRLAEQHTREQFAEHGGLSDALRGVPEHRGGKDRRHERQQKGLHAGSRRQRGADHLAASPSRYVYPSSPAT